MWSLLMGLVIRLKFGIPEDLLSVLDAKCLATRPVNMFQTSSSGPEKANNTVWVVKGNDLPLNPPTAQEVGLWICLLLVLLCILWKPSLVQKFWVFLMVMRL